MITGTHKDLRITALADRQPDKRIGETLYIGLPPAPTAVYDSSGRRLI